MKRLIPMLIAGMVSVVLFNNCSSKTSGSSETINESEITTPYAVIDEIEAVITGFEDELQINENTVNDTSFVFCYLKEELDKHAERFYHLEARPKEELYQEMFSKDELMKLIVPTLKRIYFILGWVEIREMYFDLPDSMFKDQAKVAQIAQRTKAMTDILYDIEKRLVYHLRENNVEIDIIFKEEDRKKERAVET